MDWKKFLASFFQVVPWVKNLRFILGAVIVAFIGFTVYRAYFVKQVQQTQNAHITAQPGSTVNYTTVQNAEKKRKWWVPAPFVDVYTFVQTDDTQGFGVRFGGRWEF